MLYKAIKNYLFPMYVFIFEDLELMGKAVKVDITEKYEKAVQLKLKSLKHPAMSIHSIHSYRIFL